MKVLTGISALYELDIISYSPSIQYYEMPIGTNPSNYYHKSKKYKISLQRADIIKIGAIKYKDKFIYVPERLFIELNKFPLEATIKIEAIKNLEKRINPNVVKRYYEKLKKNRRGIDKEYIEKYLEKNLLTIDKLIKEKNADIKSIIREYIMAIISKFEIPFLLIKGGSAIELYINSNRATLDIDTHIDKDKIQDVISVLENKDNLIYFDIDKNNLNYDKKIIKLNLIPKTMKRSLNDYIKNIIIPICFNTWFSGDEINNIISDYKITKRQLRRIPSSSVMLFSKEMLIAEKYQSLISKPNDTTRTKDFIDLYLIGHDGFDNFKFKKWFFKKWDNQRNSKSHDEVINIIKNNYKKKLTNIIANFENAIKMYDLEITFKDCLEIYEKIHKIFLNELNSFSQ